MKTHNLGELEGLIQRILNLTPSQIQMKSSSAHKLNLLPLPNMKTWEGKKTLTPLYLPNLLRAHVKVQVTSANHNYHDHLTLGVTDSALWVHYNWNGF